MATATDPDGEMSGILRLTVRQSFGEYSICAYHSINERTADAGDEEYNITDEVEEEDDENIFFFSWTNNVFGNPAGNGNIDDRADDVNYNDEDSNGDPIAHETPWTIAAVSSGKFRVVLKHQPWIKGKRILTFNSI